MKNINKFTKEEIIMTLRNSSEDSRASQEYKRDLLSNLEGNLDKKDSKNIINFISAFMAKNKLLLGVVALVLTLGLVGWVYALVGFSDLGSLDDGSAAWSPGITKQEDSADEAMTDQETPQDTSAGSTSLRIATVVRSSLADAAKVLSFTPRTPSRTISGAELTVIETAGNEEDTNVDQLYLTYGKVETPVFKISESKFAGSYEAGIIITVDGVSGSFYEVENWEEENNPDAIAFDGGLSPRSYIFWSKDGVTYEISEFGTLSQAQLIELGDSMK